MPRKKDKKKQLHPTETFGQMVSNISIKKIKEYVIGEIRQSISPLIQTLSPLILRVAAVEQILKDKLNLTDSDLEREIIKQDDKLHGLEIAGSLDGNKVKIVAGDTVRVTFSPDKNFTDTQKLVLRDVGNEPYTLIPNAEKALLEVELNGVIEVEKTFIRVDCISRKIEATPLRRSCRKSCRGGRCGGNPGPAVAGVSGNVGDPGKVVGGVSGNVGDAGKTAGGKDVEKN